MIDWAFYATMCLFFNKCWPKSNDVFFSNFKRNKKKKIPLMTGEEVDINLDAME